MGQEDKIIQITGSGDVIYALSADGKIYVGTLDPKLGFEWGILPDLGSMKIKKIPMSITAGGVDDDGSKPMFTPPPDGEIKTAVLLRDETPEEPKADAPKAEAPKADPAAVKK